MIFLIKYAKPLFFMAIAIAFLGAFSSVYHLGKLSERKLMLEKSVIVLRERQKNDQNAKNLDDNGLCIALGGVPNNNGKCM